MTTARAADQYSRPYSVRPTTEFVTMMEAIDQWIHSDESNPPTMVTVEAMLRGLPYGDSTCDNNCHMLNYPHWLQRDKKGGWIAHYQCRQCGKPYTCWWADARVFQLLGM